VWIITQMFSNTHTHTH